jgi:hypothetical protein
MPSTISRAVSRSEPRGMPAAGRDRAILVMICVAIAGMLAYWHHVNVDEPNKEDILLRHEKTVQNLENDPYEYKYVVVAKAIESASRATKAAVFDLYGVNGFLSLLAFLFAHQLWIGRLYGPRTGITGTLLLAAILHAYFQGKQHSPYDFWGAAGFCVLISGAGRNARFPYLCAVALVTGFVFDKHVLVPLLWAWARYRDGEPWKVVIPKALVFLLFALAAPIGIRLLLGTDRPIADVTAFSDQTWGRAAAHHLPLILPFLVVLFVVGRDVPPWVRLLWIHVPVLALAYLFRKVPVDEVISFWPFLPIFTATGCAWWRRIDSPTEA